MEIDIKKLANTSGNILSVKLLDAIHIINSAIKFNEPQYKNSNEKRMKDFVKQFEVVNLNKE